MIATIETLLLLSISLIGVLLYRSLIRSRWFNQLIGEVIEPPPEGEGVVDRLQADREHAAQVARDLEVQAAEAARSAKSIQAELPTPPAPTATWTPAEAEKKPRKPRAKKKSAEIPPESAND